MKRVQRSDKLDWSNYSMYDETVWELNSLYLSKLNCVSILKKCE